MTKQVLFIQGAGEGAYEEDGKLVKSLQDGLGSEYNVRYPKMPEDEDQGYEDWKGQILKELAALDDGAILVGHSVGSSMLLKYLSEEKIENSVAGIFLLPRHIGESEAGRWMSSNWMRIAPQSCLRQPQFSFIIVMTTRSYPSHIWLCMQKSFRRRRFGNSMGVGISLTTICLKLPQI